jgi:HlyD family secretion protein
MNSSSRSNDERKTSNPAQDSMVDIVPGLVDAAAISSAPRAQADQDDWSYVTKELLDGLPQVWTRGLLYFIVLFVGVVLPWSLLSEVDETGSARGRLEPKGKTFRIDSPVTGTVASIKVKEGQMVKKGQALLELESELARTDLQQAQTRLEGQLNRVVQLESSKNQLELAIRTQRLQGEAQQAAQRSQMDQTKQQYKFASNALELSQERVNIDQTEVERYRTISKEGLVPKVSLVTAEKSLNESRRALKQAQSDMQQARYKLAEQQDTYNSITRSGELAILESKKQVSQLQTQVITLQSEISQSRNQIASLQFQLQRRVIRSPIDGTVFRLPTQRSGAVAQMGQMVAQLAPEGAPIVLKAAISSRESGFIRVGMPVKLKFDAYPFQDYGIVEGTLTWISPDSEIRDTPQGKSEIYELEVTMSRNYVRAFSKQVLLTPGQTATAEVIIRKRRIIDFFTDPFKQLQKDGVKL